MAYSYDLRVASEVKLKDIEEVETQILETKKLIHVFEEKIGNLITKVWGE